MLRRTGVFLLLLFSFNDYSKCIWMSQAQLVSLKIHQPTFKPCLFFFATDTFEMSFLFQLFLSTAFPLFQKCGSLTYWCYKSLRRIWRASRPSISFSIIECRLFSVVMGWAGGSSGEILEFCCHVNRMFLVMAKYHFHSHCLCVL